MNGFAVVVGVQTRIDITMEEGTALLDEVVVVGYGTQKKSDLTVALVIVQVEQAYTTKELGPPEHCFGCVPVVTHFCNESALDLALCFVQLREFEVASILVMSLINSFRY